jgi:hypothetical protein
VEALVSTEHEFMRRLMLALGRRRDMRVWRQNVGSIAIRDESGRIVRVFHAGPPKGAADLSGYVRPEGWRLEVEIKGPDGEVRPEQEVFARNVIAGGCVYVLVAYDNAESMNANVTAAVQEIEAAIRKRRDREDRRCAE